MVASVVVWMDLTHDLALANLCRAQVDPLAGLGNRQIEYLACFQGGGVFVTLLPRARGCRNLSLSRRRLFTVCRCHVSVSRSCCSISSSTTLALSLSHSPRTSSTHASNETTTVF